MESDTVSTEVVRLSEGDDILYTQREDDLRSEKAKKGVGCNRSGFSVPM